MNKIYDYDVMKRKPDYSELTGQIDVDKDFNWLDSENSRYENEKMFVPGAQEAQKFLKSFDWEKNKETLRKLAEAVKK